MAETNLSTLETQLLKTLNDFIIRLDAIMRRHFDEIIIESDRRMSVTQYCKHAGVLITADQLESVEQTLWQADPGDNYQVGNIILALRDAGIDV